MYTKFLTRLTIWTAIVFFNVTITAAQPEIMAANILDIKHWQTSQGVPVYFVQTAIAPMLDIQITFNAGSARDGDNMGISALTNNLLGEGTTHLSAEEIADQLDNVGAIYSNTINRDMASINLRTLTDPKFLDPALHLFITLFSDPDFSPDVVNSVKENQLENLKDALNLPDTLVRQAFFETIFKNHPYGHIVEGVIPSLKKITPAEVENFYHQYYVSNNAIIAMVGDINLDKAKNMAEQIAHALPPGKTAEPLSPTQPVAMVSKQIYFPVSQTTIVIGQVSIKPNDPDYFPLYLGNYILGDNNNLTSRLSTELRQKNGLVYSVGSEIYPLQANGAFIIELKTRNEDANIAVAKTQDILQNFIQNGPTLAEVAEAKKALINGLSLRLDSNNAILTQLIYIGFYHLPLIYLDTYAAKINAITPLQIVQAFQRHFDPNSLVKILLSPS